MILTIYAFPSFSIAQDVAKPKESGISAEVKKQLDAIPLIADTKTPEEAGLKRISKTERIWLDPRNRLIVIDGSIAINDGPLEMFACPRRTKEHESVVSVDCKSSTAHAALLAIGAVEGTPVEYDEKGEISKVATGDEIEIFTLWKNAAGQRQENRAQEWVRNGKTGKQLDYPWVFVGSMFSVDEETKRSYYQADAGEFICVSNFRTATLDLPIASSDKNAARVFEAFAGRIPPRGTPIRLVLILKGPPQKPTETKATGEAKPEEKKPTAESGESPKAEAAKPPDPPKTP
jgi:hypothetical protein